MNTTNLNKELLLDSVSADSRKSFNMFYNIYYAQVFRFAYYFLKNKEACREVVSDVFFSIWQSRKKLKEISNIDTYLYVVTRNEANRYLNRSQDFRHVPLDKIPIHLHEKEHTSPEDELFNKEIEVILTQAINELPEKCRIIFLMARQENLKPKEIAEILSINENTVRVQMKIAIEKIVAKIKPVFPYLTLSVLFSYMVRLSF